MLPGQPDFTDPATWGGVSEEEVITVIKDGGRIEGLGGEGSGMQPDGGSSLSDDERQAVVEYIMGLAEGGGEGGGHAEKPMPNTEGMLIEGELHPHEIGFFNFLVLLLVMAVMFGVNRVLNRE